MVDYIIQKIANRLSIPYLLRRYAKAAHSYINAKDDQTKELAFWECSQLESLLYECNYNFDD